MAASVSSTGRSLFYGLPPSMWRRRMTRAMPDQETRLMDFLIGDGGISIKHPAKQWTNYNDRTSFFLDQDDQPAAGVVQSNLPGERRNSEIFRNTPHRRISAFFDTPDSIWNLGRPRRRHRPPTVTTDRGNPQLRSSYLALDKNPFSSFRDEGERQLLSFGARKILAEPEEEEEESPPWRRPTQRFWRRLRSLNDGPPSDYHMLRSAKRQPPPGFHAIRGKRELQTEEDGREAEEEGEAAVNRWMRHVAGRIRHEML